MQIHCFGFLSTYSTKNKGNKRIRDKTKISHRVSYLCIQNTYTHYRNRKYFPCFHTVIETLVKLWENEKLKWEHEPVERVFCYSSRKLSRVQSITYGNTGGGGIFYYPYKITRAKLKRGNNSPYCWRWRMQWHDLTMLYIFTVMEIRHLVDQSSHF